MKHGLTFIAIINPKFIFNAEIKRGNHKKIPKILIHCKSDKANNQFIPSLSNGKPKVQLNKYFDYGNFSAIFWKE
jgi:hypothetical protein